MSSIKRFEDIKAWVKARELVKAIYGSFGRNQQVDFRVYKVSEDVKDYWKKVHLMCLET